MPKTLISFPGRAGDIIWMLPTARAISETLGEPVYLQIASEFHSMLPLLAEQPYLQGVHADTRWTMSDGWEAPEIGGYDQTIHLGYRRWPELPLPEEIWRQAERELGWGLADPDLTRPWITVGDPTGLTRDRVSVVYGWSDCHFELKYATTLLTAPTYAWVVYPEGSRWDTEAVWNEYLFGQATSWLEAAETIWESPLFVGCCSALHVLAVALGKPVVIYEPMEARHNPIFYPLGMDGPQVTIVRGNDQKPTTDSRHTAELLQKVLGGRRR